MHNICFIADVAVFLRISVGHKNPRRMDRLFYYGWLR